MEYLNALNRMEHGGAAYRQAAGNFRGFTMGADPCTSLCLCYLANLFCCGGRGCFAAFDLKYKNRERMLPVFVFHCCFSQPRAS